MIIASEIFHKSGNFIGKLVIYVDFLHTKYQKGCTKKMIHPFGNNKKLFNVLGSKNAGRESK